MAHHVEADSLVIGGGPAGLSAALYLARYCRSVAVFDLNHGRSTHHQVNHNYLGFPHGIKAADLRGRGLEQLQPYDHVSIQHHRIDEVEVADGGFVASGQFGTAFGRTVILCMGVVDHYPHFNDWESYIGRSMFWCITCDGYESRGCKIVVAGNTDGAAGEAMQMTRYSDDVTLITNSHRNEIHERFLRRLQSAGIPIIHDKILQVRGDGWQIEALETESGRAVPVQRFFVVQGATPESRLAQTLGVRLNEAGYIIVNEEQQTNVPGVFAAGDITCLHSHQISAAVHEGAQAASAANYYLYPPELKVAVEPPNDPPRPEN